VLQACTENDETSMFVRFSRFDESSDSLYDQRQNVDVHTMPGIRYKQLAERAAENYGYLTGQDARELGVPMGTLNALARRGQLDRVDHGIYRVPLVPPGRLDQYKLATLWPDGRGVISHESALDLYGISDVNPAKLHVTVPRAYRTHRKIPALYVLHREEVADVDRGSVEGIAVVSVAKALRQVHEHHLRVSLVEQAIDDAEREGWLRRRQADQLRRELLGRTA
jgi:predicted transcriptional regulator of viral defense system